MKKAIKWIFFAIIIVIFAIDVAGFWKYKLKKSNNSTVAQVESEEQTPDKGPDNSTTNNEVEYVELSTKNFVTGERLFITDITEENNGTYAVKGLVYDEYQITKDEYDKLKAGTSTTEIFGIEYSKDKITSNNLKLKSTDEKAENLYIKYDSKTKKYILKDSKTDYSVYKATEKYVQTTVDGSVEFDIVKNGKTIKKTVKAVASSYNKVSIPKDTIKINLSAIKFNKKGICSKTKKYILKDSKTDYSVYKATEKYVQTTVDGSVEFDIVKNGKTIKKTVKAVASSYNKVSIPKDTIKINLSAIKFNKKGICSKITETDVQ